MVEVWNILRCFHIFSKIHIFLFPPASMHYLLEGDLYVVSLSSVQIWDSASSFRVIA